MKPINLIDIMTSYDAMWEAQSHADFVKKLHPGTDLSETAQRQLENAKACWHTDSLEIAEAIKEAEGKARSRTITPDDIMEDLCAVQNHLRISKTAMKGITVTINHNAQTFPNAYKKMGNPESTYFSAEHNGKGWKLTEIYRDTCRATKASIHLTDNAKTAIIRNAEAF